MYTSKITIQPVGLDESTLLAEISKSTFYETFVAYNTKEDMDQYLAENCSNEKMIDELIDPCNQFLFAMQENEPIGYVKLRTSKIPDQLIDLKSIEIERIYVSKTHHNKKIGALLMQHCLNLAKDNNYEIIWLAVWENNSKAMQFYENWGFEKFDSQIFVLGTDKQNDLLMKKSIIGESVI